MASTYKDQEKRKAVALIQGSPLFGKGQAGKMFMGKVRDFVLLDGTKNIFDPIRNSVIDYFSMNKISWWGGNKPTGHVLSSQIACINHLFPLRDDKNAVLRLLKTISPHFIEVLEIKTDVAQKGYIQFEAVSEEDHLNECRANSKPTRGNYCTSIDALIYAKHEDGSKWLIPIEWKYTERYDNQDKAKEGYKKDPVNCKGEERKRRYTTLINNSSQLKTGNHSPYYYEPFYQLMRQTLWVEQMTKNKNQEILQADNYLHIHVIPEGNKDLLLKTYKCSGKNMADTWKSLLIDPRKYQILSPQQLLSSCVNNQKYSQLEQYLKER